MRVLVPLDDSPGSWDALEYAFESFPDATFVALTVLNPIEALLSGDDPYAQVPRNRAKEEAKAILKEAEEVATVFDADLQPVWMTGRPADEIVDYVEENDIDHVVMGSHGREGVSRVLLGSTAERVVRRSPVPVTVVR